MAGGYDLLVLDLGAGLERAVRRMAAYADTLLVLVTEEPTSLTDAYAVLKLHATDRPNGDARVVVNQAASRGGGERTYATLRRACTTFLQLRTPAGRRDPPRRPGARGDPSPDAAADPASGLSCRCRYGANGARIGVVTFRYARPLFIYGPRRPTLIAKRGTGMALIRISGTRDLRVDFFRGLALWWIFTDHIPGNVLEHFSLHNFAMCDAAEMFVLLAGYGAGLAYGFTMNRQGYLYAAADTVRRAWTLYIAHIFLFVVFTAQVAYSASLLDRAYYLDEARLDVLADSPYRAMLEALLLRFQPNLLNILPLYVVLLVIFALALPLLRRPKLLLVASFALYLIVQVTGLNMQGWGDQDWYFDPFAWQFLFIIGAILSYNAAAAAAGDMAARCPVDRRPGIRVARDLCDQRAPAYSGRHARLGDPPAHQPGQDRPVPDPLVLHPGADMGRGPAGAVRSPLAAVALCRAVRADGPELAAGVLFRHLLRLHRPSGTGIQRRCRHAARCELVRRRGDADGRDNGRMVPRQGARAGTPVGRNAYRHTIPFRLNRQMHARSTLFLLLCLVAPLLSSRAADEFARPAACPVAEDLATPDEPLDQVAATIAAGGPVNILAVGTASTVNPLPRDGRVGAFPYRMVAALQAARPHVIFNLTVRGGRGITAEAMLPMIADALAAKHYQLVIWQTGTVEAVRGGATGRDGGCAGGRCPAHHRRRRRPGAGGCPVQPLPARQCRSRSL